MKVMVVGSGGREHAIAWKISENPEVDTILCAPGNSGTEREQNCRNVPASEIGDIVTTAVVEKVDLVVVGPEVPLVAGLADRLREAGVNVIGPGAKSAMLEGSKVFSKQFMKKYGVKTAPFIVFDNPATAYEHAKQAAYPLVIKADGLAAGKGVFVCRTHEEAGLIINEFMEKDSMHGAGKKLVIEEFLGGTEASVIAAFDGETLAPFLACKDHKQIFDGGLGPNTGGMGVVAPNPAFSHYEEKDFIRDILQPTITGLKAEGLGYPGFLFFGVMITKKGLFCLEYNVRLGDPEAEALLPLMKSDFLSLLFAMNEKRLASFPVEWAPASACTVVAASQGYPGDFETGFPVEGFGRTESKVFLSGVKDDGGRLVSSGGRVFALTAIGRDSKTAREKAYKDMEKMWFKGMYYRKDIGK